MDALSNLGENDLPGLTQIAKEVTDKAAIRQQDDQTRRSVTGTNRFQNQNRRPPPTRPRYNAEDASTIQKLYRTNRKKALYHVFGGPSPHCQSSKEEIHTHITDIFRGIRHEWSTPPTEVPELNYAPTAEDEEFFLSPITPSIVKMRLSRMADTAPGPDSARYSGLRRVDPGCHVLAKIFNYCLRMNRIPDNWKDSTTILIFKGGDRDNLHNWRPLSLGNTIGKLYAGILADRILMWASDGERISAEQKGFTNHEGCLEHNFVLQTALEDSRRRGEEICVAWLDMANAFGSVPHSHILGSLRLLGLPDPMLAVIQDLYTNATTRAMTPDGLTEPIPIESGVKQGCPLSPVIFDLAMEPLLRAILHKKESTGYRLHDHPPRAVTTNILAYADDLTLIARNEHAMQDLLDVAAEVASWSGLQFKPSKCASLHVGRRRNGKQSTLGTRFTIEESMMTALSDGQHYRHLGVPTGYRTNQTPTETLAEMEEKFTKLDESLLAPWQKIDAAITFLMPKLDFILRGGDVKLTPLNMLDRKIKKYAKKWLHLPNRASNEPVYMLPSQGGAGLLPLRDSRYILAAVQGYRLLTSIDPMVRRIARDSLRATVKSKVGHTPSDEELVLYLNGETAGEGGPKSFWARVRRSSTELNKSVNARWFWSETLHEIQLLIPKPGEQPDLSRVHPAARQHVCHLLRTAVRDNYVRRLLKKPDQGKVHEVALRWSSSNHMMRTGYQTRFADWRFLHRARLDCVPLNATKRFGSGDKGCRRCSHQLETLPHVLSCCLKHSAARQLRHNNVLDRLAKAVPSIAGEVRRDRRVPQHESTLRPDLVVIHEASKTLTLVDVAVIFENRYPEFQRARDGKISKYAPIADDFRGRGWTVNLDAVIVGALGSWDPANEPALRKLRISPRYAKLMRKLIVSDTIRWSRDIYVEHITGRRQYVGTNTLPGIPPRDPPQEETQSNQANTDAQHPATIGEGPAMDQASDPEPCPHSSCDRPMNTL